MATTLNPLFQSYMGRAPTAEEQKTLGGMTDPQFRAALNENPAWERQAANHLAFPTMSQDQVRALAGGTQEAREQFLQTQYQSIFGRPADAPGLADWSNPATFAAAMGDGTMLDNFVGQGVTADPNGSAPWDKTASWALYRKKAEDATAGLNRMPGIFADYGSVPTDAAAKNALFYMAPEEATKAAAANPLLSGVISAAGLGGNGQGGAPAGTQVPYGFYRSDDPMFQQAQRIGNEVVIDGVTYWEPI